MERHWDEDGDLWEHQGTALTVGDLRRAVTGLDESLSVRVLLYRPSGDHGAPVVMEIGLTGEGETPDAVVVTVVEQ